MLVYVNQLAIQGTENFPDVMGAIGGWLKVLTGRSFSIKDLTSGEDFQIGRQFIRTLKADTTDIKLYSILFSNPDQTIKGRDWITEISIRSTQNAIEFSILLETKDISTQVKDIPSTTKPKVVEFLNENTQLSPATTGVTLRTLKGDVAEELKAFLIELERDEREYPIVLMSKKQNGDFSTNPLTLQKHLIGLAQVYTCDQLDSWLMSSILSKEYSTWDGSINIIYPRRRYSKCKNLLLLSGQIVELLEAGKSPNLEILSVITHYTNPYRSRRHFGIQDVKAKRSADQRAFLKARISEGANSDYKALFEEALTQIDSYDEVIVDLKSNHQKQITEWESLCELIDAEKDELQRGHYQLQNKLNAVSYGNKESHDLIEPSTIFDALEYLTPPKLLALLEKCYPDRVIILESAFTAAEKSTRFAHTSRLANLLHRLMTDYYQTILSGSDAEAKNTFTDSEYAAKESETVRNNSDLSSKRIFIHEGKPIQMYRHLKIGVADNVEQTIRVHFEWDATNKKILIGYCGPHLPLN